MKTRNLGRGGPAVSPIGLGAMSFAGVYGTASEDEAHATLRAMLDLGIDHVDTANVYGNGVSETMIGRFLAGRKGEPPFRVATKGGITRDARGKRTFDNSTSHLQAELDGSLKRLGLEQVELYYVHRRDLRLPIEEVAETLAGFVAAGKVARIGFSEIAPSTLRRAAAVHPVAAVQSEYSLATRAPELGLVQACAEVGAALVAFSPVGRAMLTDTPPTPQRVAASDFLRTNPRFEEANLAANLRSTDALRRLAAEMGTPTATLSIAWLLAQAPHIIPIPGTRSTAHLAELANAGELALSDEDLARIEECLPVGWAHGDRYSHDQWVGPERYS